MKLTQCSQLLTQISTDCKRASLTLETVLGNEEDLARLSFLNQKTILQESEPDMETLPVSADIIADMVESYLFQIRALTLEAQEMLNLIKNKTELAELNLDYNRNQLMVIELILTFLTAGIDLCCVFGGLFGMNVVVPFSDSPGAFYKVLAGSVGIGVFFFVSLMLTKLALERRKYA